MTISKDNGTFRLESIITSILHRTTSLHFILFLSILSTFELQRIVLFIIFFLFLLVNCFLFVLLWFVFMYLFIIY